MALALCLGLPLAACSDQTGLGLNLVSSSQMDEMGEEAWTALRKETPASRNGDYQRRAERVANRVLAAAGENPDKWEVVVFAGKEANAFALPSGKIGVYEGMMELADSDAQLAAVIGHEIGHNQSNHAGERASSQMATDLGVNIASAALGAAGVVDPQIAAGVLGAGAQFGMILPYGRNQELEADRLGLSYMAEAGYDPRASIELWQSMAREGARAPAFLSTHPNPEQRIAQLRELMPEALAEYEEAR